MSLTRFATQLGDDHVRAFLIRPNQNAQHNQEGYPDHWQRMKEEVVRILPKIAEPDRWQTVIYDVQTDVKILTETPAGRVLFRIDPEHVRPASRRGKATKLAVLWVEDREIHREEWQD
jgi:hypothetical protein